MKKLITIFASIILMTLSANVMAQNTDNATATASAKIIAPIQLENDRELNFGAIAKTSIGGNVTATPAENTVIYFENPNAAVTTLSSNKSSARFIITGEEDALFGISFTDASLTGTGDDMIISDFTSSVGTTSVQLIGTSMTFYVGATLQVNPNQATGEYTGEFEVTVSYN